jgi:hypothetical protein
MMLKLRPEFMERYGKGTQDLEAGFLRDWQTKQGVKVKYPSPEDQKALNEAGQKAADFIIKKQESDGDKAARKVWDYYMASLKKYEDQRAGKK